MGPLDRDKSSDMVMTFNYFSPETPGNARWNVDLGNVTVRLGSITGIATIAEMGTPGISTITLDDLTGTLGHASDDIVGLKQFYINELAAPSGKQRLFTGYIGKRTYKRGTDSLRTGAMRKIEMEIIDPNTFLNFRVLKGGEANRPAETVTDRITWLLGYTYLSDTIFDLGFVQGSTVAMDAADYTGQRPIDVINDCAQQTSYNFFVYYSESDNEYGLFFANNDTDQFNADFALTNDLATFNGDPTYWRLAGDIALERDPARVSAGVYVAYANGAEYATDPTTGYYYGFRDAIAPTTNVKTSAKALALANTYLGINNIEDDTVTCTVKLAAADVTGIKAGQQLPTVFTNIPTYNYGTDGWVRVLECHYAQDEETSDYYNLTLKLTPIIHSVG
jgi:hypothetical protein